MTIDSWCIDNWWGVLGPLCFGIVVGWVTYRTLRRTTTSGLGDIAAVVGAVGGGTVLTLFPQGTNSFNIYAVGLASGFFFYLIVSLILTATNDDLDGVMEWLGEPQKPESAEPRRLDDAESPQDGGNEA